MATKKEKRNKAIVIIGLSALAGIWAYKKYGKKQTDNVLPSNFFGPQNQGYNPNSGTNWFTLPGGSGGSSSTPLVGAEWGTAWGSAGSQSGGVPGDSQSSSWFSLPGSTASLPRGLKNNNPLNIIITGDQWQGKVSPNTDGKFEQFQNILYGYRAAIKTLKSYFNTGRDTIAEITQRWAPAGSGEGNNPQNYANRVSNGTGISVNAQLPFTYEVIVPIVREMAVVENGESFRNKISDSDIMKAWQMI